MLIIAAISLIEFCVCRFLHCHPFFLCVAVVPVLFQHTLKQDVDEPILDIDHILGVEPMKICSPATETEIALGLRVLQGCCLLHEESKNLANHHSAIKVSRNYHLNEE